METQIEKAESQLQTQNSQTSLRGYGQNEISLYEPGKITANVLVEQNKRLKTAFPEIKGDYLELMNNIIKEQNKSDEWLIDAVTDLIMNYRYPSTPRIADLLGYDKRVKTFTYEQVCKMVGIGEKWGSFIKRGDCWLLKKDLIMI